MLPFYSFKIYWQTGLDTDLPSNLDVGSTLRVGGLSNSPHSSDRNTLACPSTPPPALGVTSTFSGIRITQYLTNFVTYCHFLTVFNLKS